MAETGVLIRELRDAGRTDAELAGAAEPAEGDAEPSGGQAAAPEPLPRELVLRALI
ncbi:MAG TPA: hypothetical protein VF843_16785 [Streptosporangiaceae bacterium]